MSERGYFSGTGNFQSMTAEALHFLTAYERLLNAYPARRDQNEILIISVTECEQHGDGKPQVCPERSGG